MKLKDPIFTVNVDLSWKESEEVVVEASDWKEAEEKAYEIVSAKYKVGRCRVCKHQVHPDNISLLNQLSKIGL